MPRFSIVITVYNGESTIISAIDGALAQNFESFEVIVVDDGSTDSTRHLCEAVRDERFTFYSIGRRGRAIALNYAIEQAVGDYIAINDADDLSLPCRLGLVEKMIEQNPRLQLLGTDCIKQREPIGDLRRVRTDHTSSTCELYPITADRIYRSNPFIHSTVVFRKSLWERVSGYDEGLDMCIDYDFFLRAFEKDAFGYLPLATVVFFVNPKSFYKRKSKWAYLKVLIHIRSRARHDLDLSIKARFFRFMPYITYIRSLLF